MTSVFSCDASIGSTSPFSSQDAGNQTRLPLCDHSLCDGIDKSQPHTFVQKPEDLNAGDHPSISGDDGVDPLHGLWGTCGGQRNCKRVVQCQQAHMGMGCCMGLVLRVGSVPIAT